MLSKKDLWIMILNTSSELEAEVLDIILNEVEEDEEVDKYLDNVLEYGCQSGCVSSLIYHKDCEKFVKKHLSEVLDIYNPADLPPQAEIAYMEEPIVTANIMTPKEYVGNIMDICQKRRGIYIDMKYFLDESLH